MVFSCVSVFSSRILPTAYLKTCLGLKIIAAFGCQFSKMDFELKFLDYQVPYYLGLDYEIF